VLNPYLLCFGGFYKSVDGINYAITTANSGHQCLGKKGERERVTAGLGVNG
jgi:hypothetical protein